jgi:hypothetical protein
MAANQLTDGVDTVTCALVIGTPNAKHKAVQTWNRPGINSPAAHVVNQRARWQVTLVFFGTYAQCLTWIRSVEALVGSVLTITNSQNQAFTNCLPTMIGPPRISNASLAAGGANDCQAQLRLAGEVT